MTRAAVLCAGVAAFVALPSFRVAHAKADANVVIVKMIDKSATEFVFEPAKVLVKPGDIVRFVMTSVNVHNIEFRTMPVGVDLGASKTSGYMTAAGQTFDLVIDKKFVNGEYGFLCTPHQTLGMKGLLVVSGQ